jgi:hypothetical protein
MGNSMADMGPAQMPSGGPEDMPAIAWRVPPSWQTVPNPNAMRIATYHAPKTGADAEDAEMSVMRAGGSTDANIQRWVGQFADPGTPKRAEKKVRGFKVSVVEVSGTYQGGGMMGGAPAAKPGFTLLGAIVETNGSPYFFKMIGPAATIAAARPAFDTLIDSIRPAGGDTR